MQRPKYKQSFLENLTEGTICLADMIGEKMEENLGISRKNIIQGFNALGGADFLYGAYLNSNPIYILTGCLCLATAIKPSIILLYKPSNNWPDEKRNMGKVFNYGLLGLTSYGLVNVIAGGDGLLQAGATGDTELKSASYNVLLNEIVWMGLTSSAYLHQTLSEPKSKNV